MSGMMGLSLTLSRSFDPRRSCVMLLPGATAAAMPAEDAWKALANYEYGKDMAALLTIDREVIRAMATPAGRSACAARLAAVLEAAGTTPAAKQYICCQLRQVGTAAEVPALARLLANPRTSQMARYALESIPGEESVAALRNALDTLHGDSLIGAINSVAARKDVRSVAKLKELAVGKDSKVASAAFWALGNIANPEAIAFIRAASQSAGHSDAPRHGRSLVAVRRRDWLPRATWSRPKPSTSSWPKPVRLPAFDRAALAGNPSTFRKNMRPKPFSRGSAAATPTAGLWLPDASRRSPTRNSTDWRRN